MTKIIRDVSAWKICRKVSNFFAETSCSRQICSHTPSALNAEAKRSGATCHMAMPQCCYLAKGAKRPSHTTNTIKFDGIPFDPCNSIKRFDLCPFDQKNSTYIHTATRKINLCLLIRDTSQFCASMAVVPVLPWEPWFRRLGARASTTVTSHGEFPHSRSLIQQKMKSRSHSAEYFFMLQSDWLKFQIKLNSLWWKRVSDFVGIIIIT